MRLSVILFQFLATTLLSVRGISLLNGRFETTTDVQDILNLALDAAAMKETTNLQRKAEIYQNGLGLPSTGEGEKLSLQSLSLHSRREMHQTPMYNIFRHAFLVLGKANEGEEEGEFDEHPVAHYADTLVNDLFSLNIDNIETEAAIILSIWMAAVHELFGLLQACSTVNRSKALEHLDRSVAFWVGEGQNLGDNDGGHLLYNLAENAGERFGQDNGEAEVNTQVVTNFMTLQADLLSNKCSSDQGYLQIRRTVKKTVSWMTVPLVQNLIHHTANLSNEDGSSYVALYALSTIPRVAACDPAKYDEELQLDVLRQLTPDGALAAITAIQDAYTCLDITCEQVGSYLDGTVPQCDDTTNLRAAGYTSNRVGARGASLLDRDIKEIDIFLRFGANWAAEDWYSYGWNSNEYSLRQLATNQMVPSTTSKSYISIFQDYYQEGNFAHNMVLRMLQLTPPYDQASKNQMRKLVTGVLKYVVVFMTSATALQYSVEQCLTNKETALEYWDAGVSLYVGSMAGRGESLYSVADELCTEFESCLDSEMTYASVTNQLVVSDMTQGATAIDSRFCDVAATILETEILPMMIVPLLQGTIKYASFNAGLSVGTDDSSLAIGDTFARGVLPIIAIRSPAAAVKIQNQMKFQLSDQPVAGGFGAFADAMRNALATMPTACSDIGEFIDEPNEGNMCLGSSPQIPDTPADTPSVPSPNNPNSDALAFGRYIFEDEAAAEGDSAFALDVRDMIQANSISEAQAVYGNGKYAVTKGLSGATGTISLSSLSREADRYMMNEPMFNVFRYALYNDEDLDDGSGEDFVYADDVVVEALQGAKDRKLAAEGAVVMNVWMVIVHQLYEALRLCRNDASPLALIDSAVALWIGADQQEGRYNSGWMMYSIGQAAAQSFGLEEGEAPVNTQLMVLFNELQAIGRTCPTSKDADREMYHKVHDLIRTLTKPLILTLLSHLVGGSQNMVELYAVSVVPQAALCSDVLGSNLQDALFSGYKESRLNNDLLDQLGLFLRCQRFTSDDLSHSSSAEPKLKALLESLSARLDYGYLQGDLLPMGGYSPQKEVSETARIDLDILEITVLMRAQAYNAAEDVYRYGHNAYMLDDPKRYQALESLLTGESMKGESVIKDFEAYYGDSLPFKGIMEAAFAKSGQFASATRGELAEVVFTTLQVMVSFLAVSEKLSLAESFCRESDKHWSKQYWDEAVALFVGSMEGHEAGGESGNAGTLLYSFGNEVCKDFGTCEPTGESETNEAILIYLSAGRDTGKHQKCEHLSRIRNSSLASRLAIILVQGTLSFAIKNMNISARDSETLATSHILAKTVLPLVNKVNATSAATIDNALGNFATISTGNSVADLVEAFAYALRGMGINCKDVGVPVAYPEFALCLGDDPDDGNVPDEAPVAQTPTDLADGLYLTTTYVQDRADMALDLLDMEEAMKSNSKDMAKLVYRNGKNSQVFDVNGKLTQLRSLQRFSTEETLDMLDEPLFNLFMYAFQDEEGKFMSRDVRFYADSFVEASFDAQARDTAPDLTGRDSRLLPVESATALNLWMHIAHLLYKTLKDCKNMQLQDENGIHSLDIAVAYWIGDGQVAGSGESGHSLYALSERMGELFDMDGFGQSRTNTNILKLFNEAKHEMSLPGACSSSPSSYLQLSRLVNKITTIMTVPLIQNLIHSLRAGDRDRVALYGHAVVPLAAGCDPEKFEYLKEKVLKMQYDVLETEAIIATLREIYPCLGLTCSDIGVHEGDMTNEELSCSDPVPFGRMAGYEPASSVNQFARLDLDMRQLDILLQMQAYSAAENLYTYGRHVENPNGGSLSLFHLATTSERTVVPGFDSFVGYFDGTYSSPSTYADEIIRSVLTESAGTVNGLTTNLDSEQRRIIVLKTAQVLIMYQAGLQKFYQAAAECQDSASVRSPGSSDLWDQGAALMIGSLEGTERNGTQEGYMYYSLAQEYCEDFGTCDDRSLAVETNEALLSLLYSGRGAMLASGCREMRKVADEISTLLLVPVIQGALMSAIQISSSFKRAPFHRAEGFVYSRAVLPLVARVNRESARTLEEQLGFPGTSSTRQTALEVFTAFARVYPQMNVDCALIGEARGFDACSGVSYKNGSMMLWVVIGSSIAIAIISILALLHRGRGGKSKLPENNPKFFVSESAELNHSMDLLEKAFSSTVVRPRMSLSSETIALAEDMYSHDASPLDDTDFDEATALTAQMESNQPDII